MTNLALVTGPTAGIGNSFAHQLAERGYDLILVARDGERLENLAKDLHAEHGTDSTIVVADLATEAGRTETAALLSEKPVDLLVNNAGASVKGWFGETDIAEEDRHLDLLVRAPMHLCDAAVKGFRERGGGAIINVASVAAFTPRGTYGAHKAWLVSLGRWLDIQYGPENIHTMTLCPGFVRTEFHQRMDADISGVPGWMWLDSDDLVRSALRDLDRGVTLSIPSVRYKVLARLSRIAPTSLVKRVAQRGR